MKKLITAILVAAMVLAFASCGNSAKHLDHTGNFESATSVLLGAYDGFAEALAPSFDMPAEDIKMAFMGGYYDENDETTLTQGPGAIPTTNEVITSVALLPTDAVAMVDGAALVQHPMMTNYFVGTAFHVADAANVDAVVEALNNSIKNNQWMCGQPESYAVIKVGCYVVGIYGLNDNVNALRDAITAAYGEGATVVYNAAL